MNSQKHFHTHEDFVRSHTTRMADDLLTLSSLPAYVASLGLFPPEAKLTATEIGGGNLNYAFCVSSDGPPASKDGALLSAVFVKQTP
eukprot:1975576-Prymnesium_polylepis.1